MMKLMAMFSTLSVSTQRAHANTNRYVNQTVAQRNGYTRTSNTGTAVIGVDTTNLWPTGGPGRPSVRLVSENAYTYVIFFDEFENVTAVSLR